MATTILSGFGTGLSYVLASLILLFIYRLIHDRITPFDDREQLKWGNAAAAVNRSAAYLGVMLAASGSLIKSDRPSYGDGLMMFMIDGLLAIVVFTAATYAFDWIIVRHVNNTKLIAEGNLAVAVLEACSYMSLGIIVSASFSGSGQELLPGLLSAVLFSAVGVVTLVVIYAAYCAFWRLALGCDIDNRVGQGSLPAAFDAGLLLLAMSVTLWFSISGDFSGWGTDLLSYAISLAQCTLVVPAGRVLTALVLTWRLTHSSRGVYHENLAVSLTVGLVGIGIGFITGINAYI
ncbi:MAG TPA: DUF350 domain-containing protein [Candidatus Saccharimonadales bacterium]